MGCGYSVQIEGVGKRFGEQRVLTDVNLKIGAGEFIAVVGKSGCGKSTLLRMIRGLETVTEGSISFGAEGCPADISQIIFLFQEARLLPWKTVWKNIALASGVRSREAAVEALCSVRLSDKADAYPDTLSGGQKQRVALARALSTNPRLLLLDEPLGALDALTRIEMQRLIERLWQENGFTVVLVTHDISEAVYLADRVVLIEDGKVAMDEHITLARPRERNADFAYFEERILDRVLDGPLPEKKMDYVI